MEFHFVPAPPAPYFHTQLYFFIDKYKDVTFHMYQKQLKKFSRVEIVK